MPTGLKVHAAVAATAALVLAGCGSSDTGSSAPSGTSGAAADSGDSAQFDAAGFFKGKTIHVIVSANPGGGSDLFGRLVAAKMHDAIPGNPELAVTNVSGIGGNQNVFDAKESDLVIGVSSGASDEYTSVFDPEAHIDPTKVQIIGGTTPDPRGLALFTDAAKAYGDDFKAAANSTTPVLQWADTVGSPEDVMSDAMFAPWLCETLTLPCKMASVADADPNDLNLMIQRNELNTQLATQIALMRLYNKDLTDGTAKVAFGYDMANASEISPPPGVKIVDVADILDPAQKAEYERILPIIGGGGVGKHYWAGPGMPAGAVDAMRDAYDKVMSDPALVKEVQTAMSGAKDGANYSFTLKPVGGADAQKIYEASMNTFNENIDYYKDLQNKLYDKYWK